jgi:hypothetical protein
MTDDGYEHITKTMAITPDIEQELRQLATEGWEVVPGSMPVAVYHLRRRPFGAGQGGVAIDDSKVSIIRADGRIE